MPMWILGPPIPALQNDIQYHDWCSATLFCPFMAVSGLSTLAGNHFRAYGDAYRWASQWSLFDTLYIMAQEHIVHAYGWALMARWRTEVESLHTEIPRSINMYGFATVLSKARV